MQIIRLYSKGMILTFNFKRLLWVLVIFLWIFPLSSSAQQSDKKKLEAKRQQLKKEIKKIKTYLEKTKKKERSLVHEVRDLNQKIQTRRELIQVLNKEIQALSGNIEKNKEKIDRLKQDLERLKKEYAETIYQSYKNKSKESRLMFILSAEDFYQGYRRFQYLKQFAEYQKKQADSIKSKTMRLQVLNDSLRSLKEYKKNLIDEKTYEQSQINKEKEKHEQLVKKYRRKKQKYIAQIRKKQREERALTKQIEAAIRHAITKSSGKSGKKFTLTPEAKKLSGKFEANKGKLPWPVKKGLVTIRFGTQTDPLDPKLKISSSGVRIATHEGAEALAVFEGKVLAVQKNPQTGVRSVLVQHGQYISVYANLKTVYVMKGDKVKTKEPVGVIYTNPVSGKTELKFQIWKTVHKQNPADWIYKM